MQHQHFLNSQFHFKIILSEISHFWLWSLQLSHSYCSSNEWCDSLSERQFIELQVNQSITCIVKNKIHKFFSCHSQAELAAVCTVIILSEKKHHIKKLKQDRLTSSCKMHCQLTLIFQKYILSQMSIFINTSWEKMWKQIVT